MDLLQPTFLQCIMFVSQWLCLRTWTGRTCSEREKIWWVTLPVSMTQVHWLIVFPLFFFFLFFLFLSPPSPVFKPEELRQALMPTLESLYRQDPESLPFRQPVDPMLLGIPVSVCLSLPVPSLQDLYSPTTHLLMTEVILEIAPSDHMNF